MLSLGQIEVVGLPAAIEAADVALKSANVELIGYEATDGMGMVAVKIIGQVGAVKAAMAAAEVAAAKISKVFSVSIIARPNDQIEPIVYTPLTVGRPGPTPVKAPAGPAPEPAPAPQPTAGAEPGPEAGVGSGTIPEPAHDPEPVAEPAPVTEPAAPLPPAAETTPNKRTRSTRAKGTNS